MNKRNVAKPATTWDIVINGKSLGKFTKKEIFDLLGETLAMEVIDIHARMVYLLGKSATQDTSQSSV